MLVLTPENISFDMNTVGEHVPNEMYCALDLSSIENSDYYFYDIMSTVNFSAMAAELQIGEFVTQVPLNWQILLGDEDTGMMEMATVEDLLSLKDPSAFVFNPISSMYPRFLPVKVKNIFTINIRWQMPMLNRQHLLAIPLSYTDKPLCAFFADETDRINDFVLGE